MGADRMSAERRSKLRASKFGLPGERKYPVNDRSHAANAKARASEEEHKGHISKAQESEIDAKANKVLGQSRERKAR